MPSFCPNCGSSVSEGQRFCPSCGTPVGGGVAAAEPPRDTRRIERTGWIFLALGLLLPFLAIVPFIIGIILMTRERVDRGVIMLVLAILIFTVRLYFYASCGGGQAFC